MILIKPQRRYSGTTLLVACTTITMILWTAYDIVIPALPSIASDFGVSSAISNLLLFPFLLAQAVGQLVCGTISDRFGRKPILNTCIMVFFACSAICAVAPGIEVLILARIPQGFAGGACMILLMTVATDSYREGDFDKAMTVLQSLPVIGPIAAPFLGSLMIAFVSWQAIFWLLAIMGAVAVVLAALMDETLPTEERVVASTVDNLRSMVPICRETGFVPTMLVVSMVGMVAMAFLAVSSFIFLEQMDVGYLQYSVIYAITTGVGILSAIVYIRLQDHVSEYAIAWFCIIVCIASGVMFLTIGPMGAWCVVCACVPLFFIEAMFRAQGFIAMTENRERSRGAANSLATFTYSAISALGTEAASLPWSTPLLGIGVITVACGLASAAIWLYLTLTGKLLSRYRPNR